MKYAKITDSDYMVCHLLPFAKVGQHSTWYLLKETKETKKENVMCSSFICFFLKPKTLSDVIISIIRICLYYPLV